MFQIRPPILLNTQPPSAGVKKRHQKSKCSVGIRLSFHVSPSFPNTISKSEETSELGVIPAGLDLSLPLVSPCSILKLQGLTSLYPLFLISTVHTRHQNDQTPISSSDPIFHSPPPNSCTSGFQHQSSAQFPLLSVS